MGLGRLSNGERIAGVSAILLFVFMFFDWFGVECSNHSNLLFGYSCFLPKKSAWEALDYIPGVLLVSVFAALVTVALRLAKAADELLRIHAVVAILGIVSVLLILFRIANPPDIGPTVSSLITVESTVQFPIFLALLAAAGIAFGGCLAMWEEGITLSNLRAGRHRDQGRLAG